MTESLRWRRLLVHVIRPLLIVCAVLVVAWWFFVRMPGASHAGPLAPLGPFETELQTELARHVEALGRGIGARSTSVPEGLARAVEYLESELRAQGHEPVRETYRAGELEVHNLLVELRGTERPDSIVLVGAHYDGVTSMPAANDNASGVASLLALSRTFAKLAPAETLRFVLFVNEEPPHFESDSMGSRVHADRAKERGDAIRVMWSLETMGYYTDEPDSQRYPAAALRLAYPTTGNFVAFVGDTSAGDAVRRTVERFRQVAEFPSEGAVLPSAIAGVDWSDHASFARVGYEALMVTDTAPFRYPHYHTEEDLPEHVDTAKLAKVVAGLAEVLKSEVGARPK